MAGVFIWEKAGAVGSPRRVAAALALVLSLVGSGLFFGVSYDNTITPPGVLIHHSALPPMPGGRDRMVRRSFFPLAVTYENLHLLEVKVFNLQPHRLHQPQHDSAFAAL